jgi:UDP-N-acetylmuramoylalanine-D-glutamate ligase
MARNLLQTLYTARERQSSGTLRLMSTSRNALQAIGRAQRCPKHPRASRAPRNTGLTAHAQPRYVPASLTPEWLSDKDVLVLGWGISGTAAARLAAFHGATVVGRSTRVMLRASRQYSNDYGPSAAAEYFHDAAGLDEKLSELDMQQDGIPSNLQHRVTRVQAIADERLLERFDLVILSPGVPFEEHPLVTRAMQLGIPLTSELAFAAALLPNTVDILAVTGTNGKSTTTHFLSQMLTRTGLRVWSGGNLGTPLSAFACEAATTDSFPPHVAAVEVSSYQLEAPGHFPVTAACVLNVTPDHLDRHRTMEKYAITKARIVSMVTAGSTEALISEDLLAYCGTLQLLQSCARIGSLPGIVLEGDRASIQHSNWRSPRMLDLHRLQCPGDHNRVNAAAAAFLASAAVPSMQQWHLLQDSVPHLTGLQHRIELVHVDGDGVKWYNDSKATNVESTQVWPGPAHCGPPKAFAPVTCDIVNREPRCIACCPHI